MNTRLSTAELARLYDKKDWATLWPIVTRMVKHAVRRCMQHGLDPYYIRDDLMQEAYIAAWEAMPRWDTTKGSLQTWISENVRGALLKANTREITGMVGGRDSGSPVVSMHGTHADDDGGNDEQGLPQGPESWITYGVATTPEGFGDPAEEAEEELLALVPERDRDMVRRLCGIGIVAETQEEYASKEGIHRDTLTRRIRDLRKYFSALSQKPGNHEVKAA